jgi:hypothetical protein
LSTNSTTLETHTLHTNAFVNLPDAMESMTRKLDNWLDETRKAHPGFTIAGQSHSVHKDQRGHVVSTLITVSLAG